MDSSLRVHATIKHHNVEINHIAFSDNVMAFGTAKNRVHLYDAATFSELSASPFTDHGYPVQCCEFSADGALLASCSMDGVCVVRGGGGGGGWRCIARLQHCGNNPIRTCAFSPDGKRLVTGSSDSTVYIWDVNTMKYINVITIMDTSIKVCRFTPCNRFLAVGTSNGHLNVYGDLDGGNPSDRPTSAASSFAYSSSPLLVRGEGHDLGTACLDISSVFVNGGDSCRSVYTMISGGFDSLLKLWILTYYASNKSMKLKLKSDLSGHGAVITSSSFSHDGSLVVSGSLDMTVRLWSSNTGEMIYCAYQHTSLVFSDLDDEVETEPIYSSDYNSIDDDEDPEYIPENEPRYVTCCCFSKDDQFVASSSGDKTVIVWKVCSNLLSNGGYKEFNNLRSELPLTYWTVKDISDWLRKENLEIFITKFKQNSIDGLKFECLSDAKIYGIFTNEKKEDLKRFLNAKKELFCHLRMVNNEADVNTPHEYVCPISHDIMTDPVVASDGYSYERTEITRWLDNCPDSTRGGATSPMTGGQLTSNTLISNINLLIAIKRYQNNAK